MKKVLLFFVLTWLCLKPAGAQTQDPPNFSLMFHAGGDYSSGFIQGYQPGPQLGIWMGISFSDNFDGLWGLDYYTMPSAVIPIYSPSPSNPVSVAFVMPSDDVSISVN